MRIPRLTLRRLMLLVASAALGLGALAWHGRMERLSQEYAMRSLSFRRNGGPRPRFPAPAARPLSARERWEDEMVAKYHRASERPWLPVAPDPPPPE
jgi:hypothetical protein